MVPGSNLTHTNVHSTISPRSTKDLVKQDVEPKPGKESDGTCDKRQHQHNTKTSSLRPVTDTQKNERWNERR